MARFHPLAVAAAALLLVGVAAAPAPAQTDPPAPAAPATLARNGEGKVTLRATRVDQPLKIDGQLDEDLYRRVPPMGGFIQTNPSPGADATEPTEVWIAFDDRAVYVGAKCYDSSPESKWVANELRRDNRNVIRNENVAIYFDTFLDRRNAFLFEVTPIDGIYDAAVTNEQTGGNIDYNPVWDRKAGRFPGGWTVEMAIPFRALRYRPGASQVWGVNIRRTVRWKNEESFINRMPPNEGSVIFQISRGGTLVGIDAPSGRRDLELKPYAIAGTSSDLRSKPPISNDGSADAGFDVKYGVTQNLTADFTVRTDFAQVEVDEQQVNLTRFPLFFPEKREFFLEGQGIFDFGGAVSSTNGNSGLTPLLFFSRRIGLNQGREIPIDAGARLTGKVGKFSVGIIDVRTGEGGSSAATRTPATNFSVVRVKRDIFRRSSIGLLATDRTVSSAGAGAARTYGADLSVGLYDNITIAAYAAATANPGAAGGRGDDTSYRAQANYNGDRVGGRPSGWRSAGRSIPRSASCGAPRSRAATGSSGSARGPGSRSASASTSTCSTTTTSRTPRAPWRRATSTRSSPSSSRRATSSRSPRAAASRGSRSRSPSRPASAFRRVDTASRMAPSNTPSATSTRCPARSRCPAASSTTGRAGRSRTPAGGSNSRRACRWSRASRSTGCGCRPVISPRA